jgi:hypothetical protein
VLSYLETVPHQCLFRPDPEEVGAFAGHLPRVHQAEDWDAVLAWLGATAAAGGLRLAQ